MSLIVQGPHGAVGQFVSEKFGGTFSEVESVISLGTTATELIVDDPERVMFTILNLSTNIVYVSLDNTVSSSRGIIISSNGGSLTVNVSDDATLSSRSIWGVASGAASDVYILQIRRITR